MLKLRIWENDFYVDTRYDIVHSIACKIVYKYSELSSEFSLFPIL